MRPARLVMMVALFIATLGNLPLWRALAGLPELGNTRGVLFGIGFAAVILGALLLLLALFSWRWLLKPALTLCLLAAAAGAYFMLAYGIVIDRTMLVNVLLTDSREARELINWQMLASIALMGVLPALWVWRQRLAWPTWPRQALRNLGLALFGLALAVAALLATFQDFASVMRNHTQVRYLINPLNSFYALAILPQQPVQRSGQNVEPIGQDARLSNPAPDARPPLIIAVLGETARADHFGLNGYARDTTPRLGAEPGVASLRNVWSCGTNTAASVPCMFSPLGREAFNDRKANYEGLVDVLQRAGLAVLWIDNQPGGCKGVCDRVPRVNYRELQTPGLCQGDECLDEAMLKNLDERIAQLPPERRERGVVVFMHQMGSHGPAYYLRSPERLKRFTPECRNHALQQCQREQIVNAYDNTIAYTDAFLGMAIDWLKQRQDRYAPAMVYLSDHGESLGENNLYLHGLPYRIAPPEQKRVPWITWLSPAFSQQTRITSDCVAARRDQQLSHDHYFHSMLGLLGVQTALHQPGSDIYGSCRTP
ncbi:phosphoethanolamine--lipid A transferase [Ottowia testudinis]|uniref:Phosphoethanolamine--lipid A transferase n=2 Tax=Ottowia testudinis TaxID=2816950 RepID=A0A975CKD7_9BURK|nr:phosphoethanolamine--lipid A transferase [Ottowia testudinis]